MPERTGDPPGAAMVADEKSAREAAAPLPLERRIEEAETLFSQGRLLDAEERFRRILDEIPDHVHARNSLACLLWQSGRIVEAFRHFSRALVIAPDNRDIVWNSGQVFYHVGSRFDALRVYRRYLRHHPGDAEIATALRRWEGVTV
ncbi:MAG: tetratricopeptide repeat protein [Planctomycetes bacterium]|jgi:Flp pilus assembly protein TadD|nr:tetratricopeptide repeat protein [Planctomycetota bacterium]